MKTIIRGGTVVTEEGTYQGDILIEDGKISEVLRNEKNRPPVACNEKNRPPVAEVIDAAGKYVLPGAVDIHTHMDLDVGIARVIDDFYTGTAAAACGGTTTIVDHMAFGPKGCSP